MGDQTLTVRKIETEADMDAFLHFHWKCYEGVYNWVPPLWSEHEAFFDREKNPELHHMEVDYFGAWRGDELVGIICAHISQLQDEVYGDNRGFFGSFEVLEDREAAHALIKAAEDWNRERGRSAIRGPMTFSTNSELGILVEGFDTPPMILNTHSHPYYQDFIESAGGYAKEMDFLAYWIDGYKMGGKNLDNLPPKLTRVIEKIRKRRNFVVRTVNMKDFDNEVERLKVLYNSAWEKNWGFVPLTDPEIEKMVRDLKQFIDPKVTFMVEVDGRPVAFALPLPNLNDVLIKVRAKPDEPEIFALIRLLWHWKVRKGVHSLRSWALGVIEEYRGTGIDALLYYEIVTRGITNGYMVSEGSWILENNDMMNRGVKLLGGEIYKRYRVYGKPL